jgi:putative oxygen-independent coproporphyrinogen III oxidase
MATGELPPLGLYIHLPWCERKCPYCDFNSHEAQDIPETEYVEKLLQDLHSQQALVHGREIETLFIGGGTPSLFSGASIGRLMQGIRDTLPVAADLEATMEANPGSAEAEKFLAFHQAGINRLSIGVQSFGTQQLQALGRIHDPEQARRAIALAKDAGFSNFNIDLMHGLPDQCPEAAVADLDLGTNCGATHLSWYQLTIEPNTVFYKRPPELPVEDDLADIQDRGELVLAEAGYHQYEVSAYSKAGQQCRHNLNYWRFGDYLAVGAGAHGKVTSPDGSVRRFNKKRQPEGYMADPVGSQWRTLREEDLRSEFMLNALRLREGFNLQQYSDRTGLPASSIQRQLDSLIARGLLEQSEDQLRASALGWRFLDSVIAEFLPD